MRETSYECDQCGGRFRRKSHLEDHVRTHSGEKLFKCNDCGKGFATSRTLRSHQNTCQITPSTTKSAETNVNYCDFFQTAQGSIRQSDMANKSPSHCQCTAWGTASSLSEHPHNSCSEQHSRPCPDCVHGFRLVSDLQFHIALFHGGQKVYSHCFFCVRGFMKRIELNVHLQVHG